MLDIAFAKPALPRSGALVLLVGEGEMPFGLWQQADEATGGAIARAFTVAEFKGGKGKNVRSSRQVQDYRASWPWVSANRPNCPRMC